MERERKRESPKFLEQLAYHRHKVRPAVAQLPRSGEGEEHIQNNEAMRRRLASKLREPKKMIMHHIKQYVEHGSARANTKLLTVYTWRSLPGCFKYLMRSHNSFPIFPSVCPDKKPGNFGCLESILEVSKDYFRSSGVACSLENR